MSALLLQPIVVLPEWETVPAEPDAAIDYMAQWDYGEYSEEPEEVETLYPRYGWSDETVSRKTRLRDYSRWETLSLDLLW